MVLCVLHILGRCACLREGTAAIACDSMPTHLDVSSSGCSVSNTSLRACMLQEDRAQQCDRARAHMGHCHGTGGCVSCTTTLLDSNACCTDFTGSH